MVADIGAVAGAPWLPWPSWATVLLAHIVVAPMVAAPPPSSRLRLLNAAWAHLSM
ncbi:hypothetical protein N181_22460 [Sinorhizobium fredii USDA 205]|nr:hypothetical protein N181_22460 [Sinorhizobium fredii USDA 205]